MNILLMSSGFINGLAKIAKYKKDIIDIATVRIKDIVYLNIQIEQKYYKSKDYEAWVSGYRPALDSLNLFRNTVQLINTTSVSQTQKRKRWGIGIQAGYGLTLYQNQLRPTPYVGIGLSYNFVVF